MQLMYKIYVLIRSIKFKSDILIKKVVKKSFPYRVLEVV